MIDSSMTVESVSAHLSDMKATYDAMIGLTPLELYEILLHQESSYVKENVQNYASDVHKLHPRIYLNDRTIPPRNGTEGCTPPSILERLICPGCQGQLSVHVAYDLHIKAQIVRCNLCNSLLNYEMLLVATFIANYNEGRYGKVEGFEGPLVFILAMKSWNVFGCILADMIRLQFASNPDTERENQILSDFQVTIKRMRDNISWLSMDLVKGCYRQLDFINKVCGNYGYWSHPLVLQSSILRYHKFINLMKGHEGKSIVPTIDIDLVWHAHQTHVDDYATYTRVAAGRFIDHDDTIEGGGLRKAYARTFIFWSQRYKQTYSLYIPEFADYQVNHEASSWLPPVGIYRVAQWMMHANTVKPISDLPANLPAELSTAGSVSIIATPVNVGEARPQNGFHDKLGPILQRVYRTTSLYGRGVTLDLHAMKVHMVNALVSTQPLPMPSQAPGLQEPVPRAQQL